MPFEPGKSGNPAGKPRGAKDKRTALRALLEPHAKKLVRKAVALALDGDTTALRICIDRLIPPIKARDQHSGVGPLIGDVSEQGRAVLTALAEGRITPDEAATIMQAVSAQARIIEVAELERRIAELEKGNAA